MKYLITGILETRAGMSVDVAGVFGEEENESVKTLLIAKDCFNGLGLAVGMTIDDEKLEELCFFAEYSRAVARACGCLSNSDYSRARLIRMLMTKGFSPKVCEACADWACEHGYIKEKEQAVRIAAYYVRSRHWGKKRIAAELLGRGYGKDIAINAIESVSGEQYFDALMTLISKKYPESTDDMDERASRFSALARMGFSAAEIENAFEEVYSAQK